MSRLLIVTVGQQAWLLLQSAHHAGPCVDRIVDRIEADVTISADKVHSYHDQIVDVIQVFPDCLLCVPLITLADD